MKINLWKNVDDWVDQIIPTEILGVDKILSSVANTYGLAMKDGSSLVLPTTVVMEAIREDE